MPDICKHGNQSLGALLGEATGYMFLKTFEIARGTRQALLVGTPGKISPDDILYLVRRDPRKYSRVKELLILSEELRRAKKAFEEDEYGVLK
ncbi:unnamed protein product [Protopolystoma xenopodis]|uniref:Uncharacterized protein n=1 Tax=Protopolystoma xenopodis TaxID=117903 RepID=A0A448XII7_9PLAT|nr:unnamed protein product [Protopolystoma xenopodis]